MKIGKKLLAFVSVLVLLSGCNNPRTSTQTNPSSQAGVSVPVDPVTGYKILETKVTDKTKLTRSYQGKKFTVDGIGIATFRSHTDGDTTNWYINEGQSDEEKIKFRYLGANTPESTAKVQPWGVEASRYTKSIVSKAKLIVLENDIDVFGQKESNGRYLGFVWYSLDGNPNNLRLLNLELVELGYSLNQLFLKSDLCPYMDAFAEAEAYAKSVGAKIHGEIDKGYDYSRSVATVTLFEVRNNYDEYGIVSDSEDGSTSSGKRLRIKALVVAMIGDNMILRDLQFAEEQIDKEDNPKLTSLYAYAGYGSALSSFVKVGNVVEFYCRATKFNDTIQLSDVKSNPDDETYPFIVHTEFNDDGTYFGNPSMDLVKAEFPDATTEPYLMDTSSSEFNSSQGYKTFEPYEGLFVKTRVTIREITVDDQTDGEEGTDHMYYNQDANGNYTCYAYSQVPYYNNYLVLNLRVDATQKPKIQPTFFQLGHTYECIGYLSPYFDKYQLMLVNDTTNTFVVDVTE